MIGPDILLHPVRLRIAQVLLSQPDLTTHQIHEQLPDVPIATLYRQVGQLLTGKLLEVSDERQVRGASEKAYRLAAGLANPTAEELRSLNTDELLAAFTVFTTGVIRDFASYLHAGGADLGADRVSFAQASFWASDEEVDAFGDALMDALRALLANEASPIRRRRTLTTVLLPHEDASAAESGGAP